MSATDNNLLFDYMPDYYDGVYEMEEILKAQGRALNANDQQQEDLLMRQFIKTADADGIAIFESQLGITPDNDATLEERRQAVLIESAPPQPLTKNYIYRTSSMYGMDLSFTIKPHEHTVKVASTGEISQVQVNNLQNWLNHILPVNMLYNIQINFTTQNSSFALASTVAMSYSSEAVSNKETSQGI